jgi:hypothetical protein
MDNIRSKALPLSTSPPVRREPRSGRGFNQKVGSIEIISPTIPTKAICGRRHTSGGALVGRADPWAWARSMVDRILPAAGRLHCLRHGDLGWQRAFADDVKPAGARNIAKESPCLGNGKRIAVWRLLQGC